MMQKTILLKYEWHTAKGVLELHYETSISFELLEKSLHYIYYTLPV